MLDGAIVSTKNTPILVTENKKFKKAYKIIKDNKNLLILGKAGTGKSTFLKFLKENLKNKRMVILSPTGISAINVEGQTIHSFFKFGVDVTVDKVRQINLWQIRKRLHLYRNVELIVIDEISMVRADIMDCMDIFLRKVRRTNRPFGGVQVVFVGDIYQLPPVITDGEREIFTKLYSSSYFFSSNVFSEIINDIEYVEFDKVFRQEDNKFLRILNAIRDNSITDKDIERLNSKVAQSQLCKAIQLTTTNASAQRINEEKLSEIKGKEYLFEASVSGKVIAHPAPITLKLKEGAQVMLTNNDAEGRWVNGDIGTVEKISENEIQVRLIRSENTVSVRRHVWDIYEFFYVEEGKEGKIVSKVVGQFIQYPLKLAWAITIHKSQGLTFDRVVIDIEKGTFAHGQLYVALSRCRSLEGLVLKQKVERKHIIVDKTVSQFVTFIKNLKKKKKGKNSHERVQ